MIALSRKERFNQKLDKIKAAEGSGALKQKKSGNQFAKTYFEWLEREKHLTVDDPVRVGIFAHASNGGIRIDANGYTGVPGLYACGEATGGMRGADRLGGLSTANGLVFGRITGREAARGAAEARLSGARIVKVRTEHGDEGNRGDGREQEAQWGGQTDAGESAALYLEHCRLRAEIAVASCMMRAIQLRRESRGSHHRTDYPSKDPGLARRFVMDLHGLSEII